MIGIARDRAPDHVQREAGVKQDRLAQRAVVLQQRGEFRDRHAVAAARDPYDRGDRAAGRAACLVAGLEPHGERAHRRGWEIGVPGAIALRDDLFAQAQPHALAGFQAGPARGSRQRVQQQVP